MTPSSWLTAAEYARLDGVGSHSGRLKPVAVRSAKKRNASATESAGSMALT